MPKLLQIAISAGVGSIGNIDRKIGDMFVSEFEGKSYITYHYRLNKTVKSRSTYIKIGSKATFNFHVIWSRLFDAHGLASWYDTKKLIKTIKEINPDIIHMHNIHGYYLNYRLLFDFLSHFNKPVVWTLHDCWSFTGHCAHFEKIGCDKWKSGCKKCPNIKTYPSSLFLDASHKNFELKKNAFLSVDDLTIVAVSKWLSSLLKQSFLGEKRIATIRNGVNLSVFKPTNSNLREVHNVGKKCVLLGVASTWNNSKGLSEFIRLSQNDKYLVILIGGIDEKLLTRLPEQILAIGKTSNQNELAEYYSMADVFVNPTYGDTFPTVNIESIACGTPVVTYLTGGSPEIIDDKTGIAVRRGDYNALENSIEKIRTMSEEERIELRENCRKRAEENFDSDKCFNKYVDLYKEILDIK